MARPKKQAEVEVPFEPVRPAAEEVEVSAPAGISQEQALDYLLAHGLPRQEVKAIARKLRGA